MMHPSGSARLVALSAALVLHGALAVALVSGEATRIEGGEGATEVRLGNAFADMAAGTLSRERAQDTPPAPRQTPLLTAERPQTAPAQSAATAAAPVPIAPARPDQTEQARTAPGATAANADTPERLEAQDQAATAVTRSLRPRPRSAAFEAAHRPRQTAAPQASQAPKPAPKASPGNAQRSARAGEATGRAEATARQSGPRGQQQAAGNAASSTYPGLVMRQLSRAGKPRVTANGVAVVAFSIATNGGLASVSLARSSGSAALDKAALHLVSGAAPFPTPPAGARRSFSVRIEGR